MKLLLRLGLTLFSVLLIMAAVYFSLPAVVGLLIRSQLENQGFDSVQLSGLEITPGSILIAQLQIADASRTVSLGDMRLNFSFPAVLNGEADSLEIRALEVRAMPAEPREFSLPDPLLLPGVLKLLLAQASPLRSLKLEHVVIYDESKAEVFSLAGSLSREGGDMSGSFQLRDANARRYLLDLSLQVQDQIKLQLRLADRPYEPILEMTILSREDGRALIGSLSLDTFRLLQSQELAVGSGSLRADFSYGAGEDPNRPVFSLSLSAADLSMEGRSIAALQLDARGSLQMLDEGGARMFFLRTSKLVLSQFKQDELSVEQISLIFPESLRISENGIQLSHSSAARLDARQLQLGDIRLDAANLEQLSFNITPEQCNAGAKLSLQELKLTTAQLQAQTLDVRASCPVPGQSAWSLKMSTPEISYQDAEVQLAAERCQLTLGNSRGQQLLVEGDPDELGGSLVCEHGPLNAVLRSDFRLNAINGVGRADFLIQDIGLDADHPLFSSVLKNWAEPLEIVSGEIQLQGRYRWWRTAAGSFRENLGADVQLENIGGYYEGMLFSGLSYNDSIELLPQFRSSKGAARLSVSDIDIGIAISDFASGLSFSPSSVGILPLVKVDDLQMHLFDGKLTAEHLSFDLNVDEQDFELKVQNLDLAQLVALQKMDGLSASGRLDGVIPLRVTPRGVTIRDGRIFAETQGGRIQYVPSKAVDASKQSVPGSDKVLQVLEDLRYDTLDIGVDYSEQGDLQMQLALKGISPGVDIRRPVHFNLTLEQNLLTLLQGLRYAEGINRDIDRNVQKHFEQQQQ